MEPDVCGPHAETVQAPVTPYVQQSAAPQAPVQQNVAYQPVPPVSGVHQNYSAPHGYDASGNVADRLTQFKNVCAQIFQRIKEW